MLDQKSFYRIKKGNIFITNSYNLPCKEIVHAVAMHFPGMKNDLKTITDLANKLLKLSKERSYKSVALPLLGTGTEGLKKEDVMKIYNNVFGNIDDIDFIIVTKD